MGTLKVEICVTYMIFKSPSILQLRGFINKKLRGLSPRADYTDRAAAAGRRISANFCGYRGVTWSAQRVPTAVLCFIDRSRYFFIQVAPQLTSRG